MSKLAKPDKLIQAAIAAAQKAYVPYSGYAVGAALLGESGMIYTGCNIENAAYPVTICGERTALFKAVSEGERDFRQMAVATQNGGFPCGVCRQALHEFAPNLEIIIVDFAGQVQQQTTLADLLPHAFGPKSLDA